VIQHQDGHDLAIDQPRLWPTAIAYDLSGLRPWK
jgi:hypothetical protein